MITPEPVAWIGDEIYTVLIRMELEGVEVMVGTAPEDCTVVGAVVGGALVGPGTVIKNVLDAAGSTPFVAVTTTVKVPSTSVGVPINTLPTNWSQDGAASSERLKG